MPLSEHEQKLSQETIELLQNVGERIKEPVRITPERMEAFHKASRMRMTVNINGYAVVLQEDADAPEDIHEAVKEAMGPQPQPATPKCSECNGACVISKDGDTVCTECFCVQVEEKSNIVLASERASLTKHRSKRRN